MKSDKAKKLSLVLSVFLALILFFCLDILAKRERVHTVSNSESHMTGSTLKENKKIYNNYNPAEVSNVYINVFSTEDDKGRTHDFSDFDLIADWDTEFNPVLDANVQFLSGDKQPSGYHIKNATIKVRGNPGASLKSYRVKLVDGANTFKGQTVFNIDKNLRDSSRIANKLAHDLIIDLEHISGFRTTFLEVYIRDDSLGIEESEYNSFGLYTHIEQPNRTYLRSRGLDDDGTLYIAENFAFSLSPQLKNVSDPEYNKQDFETVLRIREGKDHTKLINMLTDLNDESKDFNTVFNTYFDEDNYLTWLSVNILLGNSDAMTNDFILYNPSKSNIFYLLPWGFNGIFSWMEDEANIQNIYELMTDVVLHRKYLEQDGNKDKLKSRIEELMADSFSSKRIKALRKQYKPVLLEMIGTYPDDVLLTIKPNEYMAYIDRIDERILMNYREFLNRFDY